MKMKKKPGLTSLDQWEFIGLESLAMQNAAKNLIKHQRSEIATLLEQQEHARNELEGILKEEYGNLPLKNKNEKNERRDTLDDWQLSERHAINARHIHQIKEVENSQDPERKVEAIIKGESLENAKADYLRAEIMVEHHHRDQVHALHDQEHMQIKELSKMHKDGVISNQSFHNSLNKLMETRKAQEDVLTKSHEKNIESVYKSAQPIHTANEITNPIDDRFERASENLKDLENYISDLSNQDSPSKLSDEYEYTPDELGIAEIHHTDFGAIVAMPSQEYEEDPEVESNIQAQFENATIMSRSHSQSIER